MSEHIFTPDEFADLPIPHLEEHKFTLTADWKIAIRVIWGTWWDMLKATYDPRLIAWDVFDYENMTWFSINSDHFSWNWKSATPLAFSTDMENLVWFFNGATIDNVQWSITSNWTVVTATLEKLWWGDIRYKSSLGFQTIDCTPAQTVTLTPWSDTVPQLNYMYIDVITNTFQNSTSGFPATEYVPLAVSYIGSALLVQNDWTYKTHQWSDHINNTSQVWHLTDINQWIREQHATWVSWSALNESWSGTATVQIEIASWVMFQLHRHITESIPLPADFYIINDETTPFNNTNNLADIITDSSWTSLNNKYYSLVIWFVYSEIPGDSKLYINKPSWTYSSESDARADWLKYTNFNIPSEFKWTAILIKRLVCRLSWSNVTIYPGAWDDLRWTLPNTAAWSSTSISSTFLDSTFEIQNITDSTKKIQFSAAWITTWTTRTATMPDKDIILADNADVLLKANISWQVFTWAISATNLSWTNTWDQDLSWYALLNGANFTWNILTTWYVTATGEVRTLSNNWFRHISWNYWVFTRFDWSEWFLMNTISGDQYGSWDSNRPIIYSVSSGIIWFSWNYLTVEKWVSATLWASWNPWKLIITNDWTSWWYRLLCQRSDNSQKFWIIRSSDWWMWLMTNDIERLTVWFTGNVLIWTTISSWAKLEVAWTMKVTWTWYFWDKLTIEKSDRPWLIINASGVWWSTRGDISFQSEWAHQWVLQTDVTNAGNKSIFFYNTAHRFLIQEDGNVVIWSTSWSAKLNVIWNSSASFITGLWNETTAWKLKIAWTWWADDKIYMQFWNAAETWSASELLITWQYWVDIPLISIEAITTNIGWWLIVQNAQYSTVTDLDNLTTGWFYNLNWPTNKPATSTTWGYVEVIQHYNWSTAVDWNYVMQRWTDVTNNAWWSWLRIKAVWIWGAWRAMI